MILTGRSTFLTLMCLTFASRMYLKADDDHESVVFWVMLCLSDLISGVFDLYVTTMMKRISYE